MYQDLIYQFNSPQSEVPTTLVCSYPNAAGAFLWSNLMDIISRKQAIEKGFKTYYTGKPCGHGHYSQRRTKSGMCIGCEKYWQKENQELLKNRNKIWMGNNPEKVRVSHRNHYLKYKDRLIKQNAECKEKRLSQMSEEERNEFREIAYNLTKRWRQKNPEKQKMLGVIGSHRRRALEHNAKGTHTAKDIKNLLEVQNYKCIYCKTSLKKEYHIDHIIALINGGDNTRYNLQILCPTCNLRKNARNPIEFAQSIGLLL